uniref:Uncharacterized protein n=1 Tax=Aegilops tauschii TaxID=37682 RepID=R7W4H9_AEGTA
MEPSMAPRRLWHVVRAVLFMLRKGMSKRKLSMDLQLLLHRGKIAGKALSRLMSANGHHDQAASRSAAEAPPPASLSRRTLDSALAVYGTRGAGREVEFSCSNTPSYPPIQLIPAKRRRRNNRRTHRGANGAEPGWYNYDAADIAKVFEVRNDEQLLKEVVGDDGAAPLAVLATPSPALWSSFGRSPAPVRQLRITDSPFPVRDDAADLEGGLVDREADEFIKKFYDQLRRQQNLAAATPEYGYAGPAAGVAY